MPEAVTAGTWARILTPGSPLFGRIAQWKGDVAGFTVSILHQGSWTLDPICYLEDLFVAPSARGRGIGRALIADLLGRAKERGWSRLYWHRGKATRLRAASITSLRQRTISSATA